MSQETLLSQSTIWLFGRRLDDIRIRVNVYQNQMPQNDDDAETANMPRRRGGNNFLLEQLNRREDDPGLARIYAFSFEANFFDLQRPAIFLVHGPGMDPEGPSRRIQGVLGDVSRTPPDIGRTGLGTQTGSFASGIRVWAYDRNDFTIRLDADTGTFDALLLETELGDAAAFGQAGAHVRSAGAHVRSAGAHVRSAGAHVRSAGAHVRSPRGGQGE
jgi:hypothetical protein